MISNRNWQDILSLVPVTTWTKQTGDISYCQKGYQTEKDVCIYPTLIWHEEVRYPNQLDMDRGGGGFDIDSILHFISQYSPNSIIVVGEMRPEMESLLFNLNINIISINAVDYLSYWENYNDVVYVNEPNNYELAILATTYASLINAPLIVSGSALDNYEFYNNKNIICVGNNEINNRRCLTKEDLEKKYVALTKTNKVILINSEDLNISNNQTFKPDNSRYKINKLFSETSLISPILASSKHQLIISTNFNNYIDVDIFLKNKMRELFPKYGVNYLTIVASPIAIDMVQIMGTTFFPDGWDNMEIDNLIYGNVDQDNFQDIAVGRLFGLTISDSSSLLARTLFLYKITNRQVFLANSADRSGYLILDKLNDAFLDNQYSTTYIQDQLSPNTADFINKEYILLISHGAPASITTGHNTSYLVNNNIWLNTRLTILDACSTCNVLYPLINLDQINYNMASKTLCVQLIRRGSVTVIASTAGAQEIFPIKIMDLLLIEDLDIGNAIKTYKNKEVIYNILLDQQIPQGLHTYQSTLILIGDPTLKFEFEEIAPEITYSFNEENSQLNIFIPKRKLDIYSLSGYQSGRREFNMPFGSILKTQDTVYTPYLVDENGNFVDFNGVPINIETDLNIMDISSEYSGYIILNKNQYISGINYIYLIINNNRYSIDSVPFFPSSIWQQFSPLFFYKLEKQKDHNIYWFALDEKFGDFMTTQINNDTFPEYIYEIGLILEETPTISSSNS